MPSYLAPGFTGGSSPAHIIGNNKRVNPDDYYTINRPKKKKQKNFVAVKI